MLVPVMWPQGLCNFWVGAPPPLRQRPPPSRHVPLAHPTTGGDVRRNGPVRGPSRPRSVSVVRGVSHGAGAASITADSLTRKGLPARRPAPGRRAGPTIPSWGLEGRGGPSCGLCPPRRPAARGTHIPHRRSCPAINPVILALVIVHSLPSFAQSAAGRGLTYVAPPALPQEAPETPRASP